MTGIKPFYVWKEEQIQKDSKEFGVFRYLRPRDQYWAAYGRYCLKLKNSK